MWRSQRAPDMKEGVGHTPSPAVTTDAQLGADAFLKLSPSGTPNWAVERATTLVLQSLNLSGSSWGCVHRGKATFLNLGLPLGGVLESFPQRIKLRVGREWKCAFQGPTVHHCFTLLSRPFDWRAGKMPGICRAIELFNYCFGAPNSQGPTILRGGQSSPDIRRRDGEHGTWHITEQPGHPAFPQMAAISGTTGNANTLSACMHFSISLIHGDLSFGGQQRTMSSLYLRHLGPGPPLFSHPACPTSFIVLAVRAESLHGHVTARSSPPWLADAVPAVLVQCAPAVTVAQTRAALCQKTQGKQEGFEGRTFLHLWWTNKGHWVGTGLCKQHRYCNCTCIETATLSKESNSYPSGIFDWPDPWDTTYLGRTEIYATTH